MMKLIFAILLSLFLSALTMVSAQVTGQVPKNKEYYMKYKAPRKPIKPDYFFIEGSYLKPSGATGSPPSSQSPLLAPFLGEDGFGFGNGFSLGAGGILSLGDYNTYPIMSFSFNYSNYGRPDWERVINGIYSERVSSYGGDMGFGIAINSSDQFVFEILGIVGMKSFLGAPGLYSREPNYDLAEPTIYDFEITPGIDDFNAEFSLSLSMRTRRFRISGAYMISRINNVPYDFTYYEQASSGSSLIERKDSFDSSFSMNYFKISLALVI